VPADQANGDLQIQIGFNLPGFTFLVPAHPGGPGQIPEEQ